MKHRSPLITLAAVALVFAIMFIVNMTVSPPGRSSTGTLFPPVTASADSLSPTRSAAPELNPGNLQVTVAGETLTAALINGYEGL